jgi:carboxysome shell carbonic anhydrase
MTALARRALHHDPAPWTRRARLGGAPRSFPVPPVAIAAADGVSTAPPRPGHPLADPAISLALRRRADAIEAAFAAIEPTLRELAPRQFESGFAAQAAATLRERLDLQVPSKALAATWTTPLDIRSLQARCVLGVFRRLVDRAFDRDISRLSDGEPAEALIRRWGFHAVDIAPCADGRLAGVVDFILRIPPSVVAGRRSHAGAMFDIEDSVRAWEAMELRRWRESVPNPAGEATRYLKIGVYHFSTADPRHEGCAAHGSDTDRAASTLLARLEDFEIAVRNVHGPAAAVATLMVGVDTDTDAIRVHVPDATGRMSLDRIVDNGWLYAATADLPREDAKTAIREAVARAAGVAPDDATSEGMRWFCGYILKNNIGQMEAVVARHGGAYPDLGHTERLIVVGDPIDEAQLRNLAFQAQIDTIEAGGHDLSVGLSILGKRLGPLGLATPVLAHVRFDPRIPGAEARARVKADRLRRAILAGHPERAARGEMLVQAVVRAGETTVLSPVDPGESPS